MKLIYLLLAFVAVTASVAYAAPQGDDEEIAIQEFLEKAMKQSPQDDDGAEQMQAKLQSLLAEMEQANKEEAALQHFIARGQAPARTQIWHHIWRVARHLIGKRSTVTKK